MARVLGHEILGYVMYEGVKVPYIDVEENGYCLLIDGEAKWIRKKSCEEIDEQKENHILENVKMIMDKQTAKGLEKYGETVNSDSYTVEGWITHLQEELVDALVYTETLKEKFKHFKKVIG